MALWSVTEESVLLMLQGWGAAVETVRIVPTGSSGAPAPVYLDGDTAVIEAERAGLPRSTQGVQVDSLTHQLNDPRAAARLAAVCAPLVTSTWRHAGLPSDPRLAGLMLELDQLRAEAQLRRRQPSLRLLLPTISTWLARTPISGSDDAAAYQLLTAVCPRADALVFPTSTTEHVKPALVDYLGPAVMREYVTTWRRILAAPDQRSAVMSLAEAWLQLADARLPRHHDRTSNPELLSRASRRATSDLEQAEATALEAVASLRADLDATATTERRTTELDPDHGIAGAGTGLPAHRSLRHRPATEEDHLLRTQLRAALSVAKRRQLSTVDHPTQAPTGRTDTRELVRMSAQQHAGTPVTATPWTRHIPEMDDQPDIRVAAVLDTSASMAPWLESATALMWAVACAAHDLGGSATVWGFGGDAFEIVRIGSAPHLVPQIRDTGAGSDGYAEAVSRACDSADLIGSRGARLLVVLTDGRLKDPEEARRLQQTLADAVASGVTVLWALTGGTTNALVPDQAIVAQGVTPRRFAEAVNRVLINTVSAT